MLNIVTIRQVVRLVFKSAPGPALPEGVLEISGPLSSSLYLPIPLTSVPRKLLKESVPNPLAGKRRGTRALGAAKTL